MGVPIGTPQTTGPAGLLCWTWVAALYPIHKLQELHQGEGPREEELLEAEEDPYGEYQE